MSDLDDRAVGPALLARHKAGITATLALSATGAVAGIALLGVSGWFLTGAALTTAAAAFNLFGPSALVRGLSFIRIGARYGEKLVGHDLTLRFLADMREHLFRRLIPRIPLAGAGLRHGDLVSRLVADVDALDAVVLTAIGPGGTTVLAGAGLAALLAYLLPEALLPFLAGYGMAALLVPFGLVLVTRKAGRDLVAARSALRTGVLDGIEGHADILLFGQREAVEHRVGRASHALAAVSHRLNRAGGVASALVVLSGGLTALAVLLVGLDAVNAGHIGGPSLVGLVLATFAAFEGVGLMTRNVGRFGAALAAGSRIRAVADAVPAIIDPPLPETLPEGGDLLFSNVWFSRQSGRQLFKGLKLTCLAGSRTAIIGASGCGKSTLFDLALRLIDPDNGSVAVAGQDVSALRQVDLHARMALMSQSTPVFLGTIADNLRLANPGASPEELWAALARARLDAFVRGLPEQLETWCGEGGRTLSAGQARRLCLARVLLTRSAILLLDEPTSGLDRETERAFLADLATATAGRTILLATHADLPPGTVDRTFRLVDGTLASVT